MPARKRKPLTPIKRNHQPEIATSAANQTGRRNTYAQRGKTVQYLQDDRTFCQRLQKKNRKSDTGRKRDGHKHGGMA